MTRPGKRWSGYAFSVIAARLPVCDAADEVLADVDLDLERVHVDDGADTGAREAAAGRDRRDHLAFLRGLDGDDAAERRADDGVVEVALRYRETGLGDTQRAARDVETRLRGVVARLGVVERLRADERGRELRAVALVHRARVVERDLRRRKVRALLLDLRRRLRDLRPHVRVVEARDDLARFDSLPFLDQHGRDLARDLGRHRGLAPRDDVAGRVEYRSNGRRRRRKARGGSDFRCGGDARLQLFRRHGHEPHDGENGDGKADGAGAQHQPRAPRRVQRGNGLLAVEPQLIEERCLIGHGGPLSRCAER